MRKLLLAAAAAAAFALPSVANAAPITLEPGSTFPIISGPTTTGDTTTVDYGANGLPKTFSFDLVFSTDGSPVSISGSSSSFGVSLTNLILTGGGQSFGMCSSTVTTDCFLLTQLGSAVTFATSNPLDLIANAVYTFTLSGKASRGGALTGNVSVTSVPSGVPEPGTWGLMLLGFGAIGFSLRRRKTSERLLAQVA